MWPNQLYTSFHIKLMCHVVGFLGQIVSSLNKTLLWLLDSPVAVQTVMCDAKTVIECSKAFG